VPIGVEDVRHVARLARLAIPEEELPRYAAELGRILEHVARLQELDTRDVPPTPSALEVPGVTREDRPRPGLTREDALAGAPAAHAGMFLVPRVVEGA
jgi:aspartyl-tRNA(Asn)/glutamyl-tRNA(Gln) amidotransferase subunit C